MSLRRATSGFTLIELVVAFALLGLLTALALGVITSIQQPTTEVVLRADITTKGIGGAALLVRELEGGSYLGATQTVATCDAAGNATGWETPTLGLTVAAAAGLLVPEELTVDGDLSVGQAVQFSRIVEIAGSTFTVSPTPGKNEEATPVTFSFVPDEAADGADNDRDGLIDEWKLVRISSSGTVEILQNLANTVQFGSGSAYKTAHPALQDVCNPHFSLEHPSSLRVRFTTAAQTGYDTTTQTRQFSLVTFDKTVFLRNQAP